MKRQLLLWAAPVLAVLGMLATTAPSQAQGFSFGGRGWSVGVGRPYYGGYGYGGYGYGAYPRSSFYYGPSYYGGYYPYSAYYGSRYYYPSYGTSYYYTQPSYSYSYPTTSYSSGVPYGTTTTQSFYPSAASQTTEPNTVQLRVRVPENARVWFFDQETQQTGRERTFISPPVTPGKSYVYQIKAQWRENGQDVTRDRRVTVQAGDVLNVDLTAPDAEQERVNTPPNNDAAPPNRAAVDR